MVARYECYQVERWNLNENVRMVQGRAEDRAVVRCNKCLAEGEDSHCPSLEKRCLFERGRMDRDRAWGLRCHAASNLGNPDIAANMFANDAYRDDPSSRGDSMD